MQVNQDMKTIITVCFLFTSIIAISAITNEFHIAARQAAMGKCQANPYQCLTPPARFASLY
jgi:hypothetical protein